METERTPYESEYLPKRSNPLTETVYYKIGGTVFEIETSCGGSELLYDKMERLTSGTERVVFRAAVLRRLWEQAVFCNGEKYDPGAGLLSLCKV